MDTRVEEDPVRCFVQEYSAGANGSGRSVPGECSGRAASQAPPSKGFVWSDGVHSDDSNHPFHRIMWMICAIFAADHFLWCYLATKRAIRVASIRHPLLTATWALFTVLVLTSLGPSLRNVGNDSPEGPVRGPGWLALVGLAWHGLVWRPSLVHAGALWLGCSYLKWASGWGFSVPAAAQFPAVCLVAGGGWFGVVSCIVGRAHYVWRDMQGWVVHDEEEMGWILNPLLWVGVLRLAAWTGVPQLAGRGGWAVVRGVWVLAVWKPNVWVHLPAWLLSPKAYKPLVCNM
jgi:hypothetical protein